MLIKSTADVQPAPEESINLQCFKKKSYGKFLQLSAQDVFFLLRIVWGSGSYMVYSLDLQVSV